MLKNWSFRTPMLEKTLENPLDCQEIKPVNPKGNQPWLFIGRTDAKAETPILWPPDGKSQLIGKNPDAGKDVRQEEKGMTEYEMVGWHHGLNGHESEQTPGDSDRQGSLVCWSPWSHRVGHYLATERHQQWSKTQCMVLGISLTTTSVHLQYLAKYVFEKLNLWKATAMVQKCYFFLVNNLKTVNVTNSLTAMYVCILSRFSHVWLFATPWTVAHQAP